MITKIKKNKSPSPLLFFSILTIFLTALLIFSNFKIRARIEGMNLFFQSLKNDIQSLEEENKRLRREIDLAQGESYWEEKIREQGYKKPDEEVIVILPPPKGKPKTEKENKESNWQENFWEIIRRLKNFQLKF